MKSLIIIFINSFFTLSLLSQGNYVFENEAFNFINKNEIAKKYGIKTISYYPNYKDSANKGKCEKIEFYDSTGILLKEIYQPKSTKEYQEYSFVYDNNKNLKELHYYFQKSKEPYYIIYLDYYKSNQLKSMTKKLTNSSQSDTLFYYYAKEGRYDYKEWSNNRNIKTYIRYNKCNEIAYIEALPFKTENIQLDSNGCVIFAEIEMGEISEKVFIKRTNNTNCQNVTYYDQNYFGNKYRIESGISEFDENLKLIKVTRSKCQNKIKEKCENNLKVYSINKFEYNNKGLQIFLKTYDAKEKLKSIYFTEFEYY